MALNGAVVGLYFSGRRCSHFFDGEQDPDPDLHQSEKSDPNPHKVKRGIRI